MGSWLDLGPRYSLARCSGGGYVYLNMFPALGVDPQRDHHAVVPGTPCRQCRPSAGPAPPTAAPETSRGASSTAPRTDATPHCSMSPARSRPAPGPTCSRSAASTPRPPPRPACARPGGRLPPPFEAHQRYLAVGAPHLQPRHLDLPPSEHHPTCPRSRRARPSARPWWAPASGTGEVALRSIASSVVTMR